MKSRTTGVVLAIFFGGLGFQWFYVGKVGKGILYLCTAGLLGIGWLISIFKIGHEVDIYNAIHSGAGKNNNTNANVNNIVINMPPQGQTATAQPSQENTNKN